MYNPFAVKRGRQKEGQRKKIRRGNILRKEEKEEEKRKEKGRKRGKKER